MDRTIPQSSARDVVVGPLVGRLVWYAENDVRLALDGGDMYPSAMFSIVQGFADGATALPRPWRYDQDSGEAIVEGDMVLVDFIAGNYRRPVVRGIVRKIGNTDELLDYDYRKGNIGNPRRISIRHVTADGEVKGTIQLRALEEDGSLELTITDGEISVTASGNVLLRSGKTATLDAEDMVLIGDGADDFVALKTPTADALSFIDSVFGNWITVPNDGGAALKAQWSLQKAVSYPTGFPGDIGATKVKAE